MIIAGCGHVSGLLAQRIRLLAMIKSACRVPIRRSSFYALTPPGVFPAAAPFDHHHLHWPSQFLTRQRVCSRGSFAPMPSPAPGKSRRAPARRRARRCPWRLLDPTGSRPRSGFRWRRRAPNTNIFAKASRRLSGCANSSSRSNPSRFWAGPITPYSVIASCVVARSHAGFPLLVQNLSRAAFHLSIL